MAIEKEHKEFFAVDLKDGWVPVPGYPPGIHHKILAGSLDEAGKRGSRTRLLRIGPGVFTTKPFVHDYWEEVFLISVAPTVGNDANGQGGVQLEPFTYACLMPGAVDGAFRSIGRCLFSSMQYYDQR